VLPSANVEAAKPQPWRGTRVLVTGVTGFVGSWLCEALLERDADVIALVLDPDTGSRFFRESIHSRCHVVHGDLRRFDDCMRAINSYEAQIVFHLGAQTIVGTALRDPLECFESNIRGTYNILESARRLASTVKTVVVASSDKAYGNSPILPYTENMPLNGRHPYEVSKSCTDLISLTYAQTYGLPVTIARCGNIYGGGDLNWSRIVPGTIRSLLRGEAPILRSDGGPVRDYLYVKDVIEGYLCLAECIERDGVAGCAFNFSAQSRNTVLEVVVAIARAVGVECAPRVLATAEMEIRNQTLNATRARERLGWSASWSLDDGLRETAEWYRTYCSTRSAFSAC
jgi:CDP-glucose 4,6-dehydratase